MAEKKNQHFVPQFYLRNFSIDCERRSVRAFLLDQRRELEKVKLRSQCSKGYFYGQDLEVENFLGILEGSFAKVIKRVLSSPRQVSSQDRYLLRMFIVLQDLRTAGRAQESSLMTSQMERAIAQTEEVDKLKAINHARENVLQAIPMIAQVSDLKVHIFEAHEKLDFITSDDPISVFNLFALTRKELLRNGGVGYSSAGFSLFCPLSPSIGVLVYDPDVYAIFKRKMNNGRLSYNDTCYLNALSMVNASNLVFLSERLDIGLVEELEKDTRDERLKPKLTAQLMKEKNSQTPGQREFVYADDEEMNALLKKPKGGVFIAINGYCRKVGGRLSFFRTKSNPRFVVESNGQMTSRRRRRKFYTDGFEYLEQLSLRMNVRPKGYDRPLPLTPKI